MKTFLAALITSVAFVGILFGLSYGGYLSTAFFAPKYEEIRRNVMIESRSYSEASVRRLYDLKREWTDATPEGRQLLEQTALHEFSIFPKDRLPADLAAWLNTIQ